MARRPQRQVGRVDTYIHGSAAREMDRRYKADARAARIPREIEEEYAQPRRLSNTTRKNREKAKHMSIGYVAFLVGALCIAGWVLINYIHLQSELTNTTRNISILESQVNNRKMENDEAYNKIFTSMDLEEVRRIAIGELGMTYAKEGQIVHYTTNGNDYFRAVDEN